MYFFSLFLSTLALFAPACVNTSASGAHDIVFVGSTPGDESVKSMLSIPVETNVDFIRWNMTLSATNTFALDIVFGESQPNTLGFKNQGYKRSIKGTYVISQNVNKGVNQSVYRLKSDGLPVEMALAKINDNLLHLLAPQNQLMVGNGGWSYSLNRKIPVNTVAQPITIATPPTSTLDTLSQIVFDGRTPCQEIASDHPELNARASCFKLKWRITLNRDSITHLPSTYTIRKVVNNQLGNVSGKWAVIRGTAANPHAVIYQLNPDKPAEAFSFLVADDNVLFWLNKDNEPYIGNEDFSFTLNRKL